MDELTFTLVNMLSAFITGIGVGFGGRALFERYLKKKVRS